MSSVETKGINKINFLSLLNGLNGILPAKHVLKR